MNTDEGLSQFIFFMPPPATKQIEILSQFWNLFPPWPYHEVDMLSRVIATNLPARPLQNTTSVQH